MLESKKELQEKADDYRKRLADLYNFLQIVSINNDCETDLKNVCSEIIIGKISYEEALEEWKNCRHKFLD